MSTLNLIPPELQRAAAAANRQRVWWHIIITLAIFVLAADGILTATWVMLGRHSSSVRAELQKLRDDERQNSATDITASTTTLNATIKSVSALLPTPLSWSSSLTSILALLPAGASLSEASLDTTGVVHLVGTCDTRQTFITLDSVLKEAKILKNVTTKSKASKRTDVPFEYTATYVTPVP